MTKRRNDGFRFVLGLAPDAVKELTHTGISVDQAMREIWRETVRLYRERHGWEKPEDGLGWVAGAHHDTKNTHLHIVLFPTTLSGKPLRTNDRRKTADGPVHDLNDMIGMANVAAEIYWREHLPLRLQSREYQISISESPEEEPELPRLEEFGNRPGKPQERKPEPELNRKMISPGREEHVEFALGKKTLLQAWSKNRKKGAKGMARIKALTTIAAVWTNKDTNIWTVFRNLGKKAESEKLAKDIAAEFPEEAAALDRTVITLLETLPKTKNVTKQLSALKEKGPHYARGVLALIVGLKADPTPEETLTNAMSKANGYETSIRAEDPETKLKKIWAEGKSVESQIGRESAAFARFRQLLRAVERNAKKTGVVNQAAQDILGKILRGGKTLVRALETRRDEALSAVERDGTKYQVRNGKREWAIAKGEFIIKENEGKPWPDHLDPDTVIERLRKKEELIEPEIPRTKTESLKEKMTKEEIVPEETTPLETFIHSRQRRRMARRRRATERSRENLSFPDEPSL